MDIIQILKSKLIKIHLTYKNDFDKISMIMNMCRSPVQWIARGQPRWSYWVGETQLCYKTAAHTKSQCLWACICSSMKSRQWTSWVVLILCFPSLGAGWGGCTGMPLCSRSARLLALSTPEQLAWLGFITTSMARFYRFHTIQDFAGG